MNPAPLPLLPLTLSPLGPIGAAQDDVVAMVVEASFEPAIQVMNYLPNCLTAEKAREYCRQSDGVVLRLDGRPVGVTVVSRHPQPGAGMEVPPGTIELDEWVLPPFRGKGILGKRGWPLIAAWLAQRFDYALSVTWADNHAAIALLRGRGYRGLGRTFWTGADSSGYCEVFLYDLAPHRAPAEAASPASTPS